MKILFWGTPVFALPSLRALSEEGHDVVGVVTQPDRPAGRGRTTRASPVKREAETEGYPLFQPERARGEEFVSRLRELDPDLSVVAAYGQILRREVLELPRHGSINVHASLLPALRGAAPINWAIIRGHTETGVSIMHMVERMDAGAVYLQAREPIGPEETATDLTSRLSEVGAATLVEALALLEIGELTPVEQDEEQATYAPRLTRADAKVDWTVDAHDVDCLIRGLDGVPGAWTSWQGAGLKLFRPLPLPDEAHGAEPGAVLAAAPHDPAQGLKLACGRGAIWIREVQPAGKRRMTTVEWLRGRGPAEGDRFD